MNSTNEHEVMPLELSIVVVNTDGTEDTLRCLTSIFEHPPRAAFEVIVVDNYSSITCLPLVHERFPQVRTLSAPSRQGFAKNYNLGLRQGQGQYLMILNNDTIVHAGALDALVGALQQHTEYGMVGPRLLSTNGRIQTVCARPLLGPRLYILTLLLLDLSFPSGQLYDAIRRRQLAHQISGPVPCLSGACQMVPRAILERIGLLDEGYDFYFEDVEWCHRVQRQGLQTAYIAEAPITHLGDQTVSKVKVWAKQNEYLSSLRYFRQYYRIGLGRARCVWLATMVAFLMRFTLFKIKDLITRRPCYASEYAQLLRWIWAKYPVAFDDDIALAGETKPLA